MHCQPDLSPYHLSTPKLKQTAERSLRFNAEYGVISMVTASCLTLVTASQLPDTQLRSRHATDTGLQDIHYGHGWNELSCLRAFSMDWTEDALSLKMPLCRHGLV